VWTYSGRTTVHAACVPASYHRRSIRLRGYNYSAAGAYFVTLCVQDRRCLFGDVTDGVVGLSDAGHMVDDVWTEMPMFYRGVDIDGFVVMPNHIHGIITLVGAGPCACPETGRPQGAAPTAISLPDVVQRFKTLTTRRYADSVKRLGWPAFRGRLWQRGYYERIIRDDVELNRIRRYVAENPQYWAEDVENPKNPCPP